MAERKWEPLGADEFERQYAAAVERGRLADEAEARAVAARYDRENGRVVVELQNGCLFAFPADLAEGLRGVPPEHLAVVEIRGKGSTLHWEALDVDFGVAGLLDGRFGSKRWMEEHGGLGDVRPAPQPSAPSIKKAS
jgi:Protein of unknown function (DUF2442)